MTKKELRHLSLSQMKTMLQEIDEEDIHAYINNHVAVVTDVVPSIVLPLLQHPIMLDEMRVMVLKHGATYPTVNLLPMELKQDSLLFMASKSIVELQNFSPDVQGMGFSLSGELFNLAMGDHIPSSMDGHLRHFHVSLNDGEVDYLSRLIHLLYDTISQKDYNSRVFLSLTASFFWYVDSLWQRQAHQDAIPNREQQLFGKFIQLINEHARREHNIDFYAEQLFLSPRYMSTVIKRISGKGAKEWIDEAIVTAIKVDLHNTDKPLKQIADEMEFPNMSFFSKYFKRMTGLTPMQYRRPQT